MKVISFVSNKTILIKILESKNRFQDGAFFNTPFTLFIGQLLDQLPQLKVQLAYAMASFWPTKKEKILTRPNFIGVATTASSFWINLLKRLWHIKMKRLFIYILVLELGNKS